VEDGVDAVGEHLADAGPIGDIAEDETRTIGDGGGVAACEVVEDDDLVPGVHEAFDARRPHVASSADDENLQSTALRPT